MRVDRLLRSILAVLMTASTFTAANASSHPRAKPEFEVAATAVAGPVGAGLVHFSVVAPGWPELRRLEFQTAASVGWILEPLDGSTVPETSGVLDLRDAADEDLPLVFSFRLAPDGSAEAALRDGFVVAQLAIMDPAQVRPPAAARVYFRRGDGGLAPITADEYAAVVDRPGTVLPGSGVIVREAPRDLQGLSPWDNPECAEEVEEFLRENPGFPVERFADALASTSSALSAAPEAGGCTTTDSGDRGWPLGLLVASVLLVGLRLRRRGDAKRLASRVGPWVVAVIVTMGATLPSAPVRAEARSVYGYLSFWDTRDWNTVFRSNDPGSRFLECDPGLTTCQPGTSDCCFTGIPRVAVSLVRQGGVIVDTQTTNASGWYWLADANWQPGNIYLLRVTYQRTGYPASQFISTNPTDYTPRSQYVLPDGKWFELTQIITYLPNASVNEVGDQTSVAGDLASHWTTAHNTFTALEAEGETRHRRLYGSANGYDVWRSWYATTSPPQEWPPCGNGVGTVGGVARQFYTALRYGLGYHCRLVGASEVPDWEYQARFPDAAGAIDLHLSWTEGTAVHGAIGNLVGMLMYRNPALAPSTPWPIDDMTWNNTNDLVSVGANVQAMWDLIDTPSSGGGFPYADQIDLTWKDLADALVSWQGTGTCQPGTNYNRCEIQSIWMSGVYCGTNPDVCSPGGACSVWEAPNNCWYGDVHGNNLRDWIHHLDPLVPFSETQLWQTAASSVFVGEVDNSHPFTGGFHDD